MTVYYLSENSISMVDGEQEGGNVVVQLFNFLLLL